MTLFMDRHDAAGVSPEEVAMAHIKDLDVQNKYGVNAHRNGL